MEFANDTKTLVAETLKGSRTAFAALVQRNHASVRGLIGRYLRDANVVDDLAQEVFLIAYQQLSNLQDPAGFDAWLAGIARNRVKMHLRSESRRQARDRRMLEAAMAEWQHDHLARTAAAGERQRDTLDALRSCLDGLSPASRRAVQGYYFDNQSAEAVAAEVNKSAGALRMMLYRIRQSLAECVRSKLKTESD